jgi:hypothetical protein
MGMHSHSNWFHLCQFCNGFQIQSFENFIHVDTDHLGELFDHDNFFFHLTTAGTTIPGQRSGKFVVQLSPMADTAHIENPFLTGQPSVTGASFAVKYYRGFRLFLQILI